MKEFAQLLNVRALDLSCTTTVALSLPECCCIPCVCERIINSGRQCLWAGGLVWGGRVNEE